MEADRADHSTSAWEQTAQDVLNSRHKKRSFDEANAPPEFAVDCAQGSEVRAQLEMTNILMELPQDIQERLGSFKEADRMVAMNACLNWHLSNLPRHLRQKVLTAGGTTDNCTKFKVLEEALFVARREELERLAEQERQYDDL